MANDIGNFLKKVKYNN